MKLTGKLMPLLTAFFLFTIITFLSCKPEHSGLTEQEEEQANIISTQSDAEAEIVFNGFFDDVFGVNNDVGLFGTGILNTTNRPPCLVVSVVHLSADSFPVKLIFDFGAGCIAQDGHFRRGKIIATYTDRLIRAGAQVTVEFDNFFIDSIHVEGTNTIANTSVNTVNGLQFTIDINTRLSRLNGNYTEWHSHKVITQIQGNLTPTIAIDDVFKVEGFASGKTRRGDIIVAWNTSIIEPLLKFLNCRWIKKGALRIARQNLSANSQWVGILDYGGGTCDNQATLTVNGRTIQITLY